MINLDENVKSEVQIRLQEKLERDRKRLQEQIKKEHKQATELKEIIDTAMTQKATNDKITAIRNAAKSGKDMIKSAPQVKGEEEPLSGDEVDDVEDEDMEEADNTDD